MRPSENQINLYDCSPTERAIRCFERWSATTVTLLDPSRRLVVENGTFRYKHTSHECQHAKSINPERCNAFCWHGLAREIIHYPEGGIKLCHAGMLDWFMPVFCEEHLPPVILSAGSRRAPAVIPNRLRIYREPLVDLCGQTAPAVHDEEELLLIHEGLAQLAARLRHYFSSHGDRHANDQLPTPRATRIAALIDHHFFSPLELKDMARMLHLSESRAGHVIQEELGKGFSQLLAERRIREAQIMLRHTDEPIGEIARRVGFASESGFLRTFKALCGETPRAFRRAALSR